ncbi:MAG: hypothetical protein ACYTFK_11905 [Planctomycetota bacterium]|jgi:hypothetical protein
MSREKENVETKRKRRVRFPMRNCHPNTVSEYGINSSWDPVNLNPCLKILVWFVVSWHNPVGAVGVKLVLWP